MQGNFRAADGYFATDQTSFWGAKGGETVVRFYFFTGSLEEMVVLCA